MYNREKITTKEKKNRVYIEKNKSIRVLYYNRIEISLAKRTQNLQYMKQNMKWKWNMCINKQRTYK